MAGGGRKFLANEEDAREAVQDAFLSAFKQSISSKGNPGFRPGLHGCD